MGKKQKKQKKEQNYMMDLIAKVDELDEEFRNFSIPIPDREEMLKENFPMVTFKPATISWCCKNVNTIRDGKKDAGEKGKEWLNAWTNLYYDDKVEPGREAFSDSPEEDQKNFISLMLDDINNSKTRMSYKKWKFALMKEESSCSRYQDDQNRAGGEEEGGNSVDTEEEIDEGVEVRDKEMGGEEEGGNNEEAKDERDEEIGKDVGEDFEEKVDEDIAVLDVILMDEVDNPLVDNGRLLELRKMMGFSFIFPNFQDNDVMRLYNGPFTLQHWFDLHQSVQSRWRPTVLNNSNLDVVWNGDRLKRESLSIMHSLVLAVLDFHHDSGRPHGNLQDHRNIMFFQCIQCVGGNQNVRFRIELLNPLEIEDSESLEYYAADMREVKLILKKILDGKPLHPEMDFLFTKLLDCYPFSNTPWKTQLLRNFTGFWDGKSRANFLVLLYYTMKCDMTVRQRRKINSYINGSICISGGQRYPLFKYYKWVHRIPRGTFFHNVLTYTDTSAQVIAPEIEKDPEPQYGDGVGKDMIKYARVCLHHNRDARGSGSSMNINEIEVCMSNLFEGLILAAYTAMCYYKLFLC